MTQHAPKRLAISLGALVAAAIIVAGATSAAAQTVPNTAQTVSNTPNSPTVPAQDGPARTAPAVTDGVVDSTATSALAGLAKSSGRVRATATGTATVTVAQTRQDTQKATQRLTSAVSGTASAVGTATRQATRTVTLTVVRTGADRAHAQARALKAAKATALGQATDQATGDAAELAQDAAHDDALAQAADDAVAAARLRFSNLVVSKAAALEGTPYKWGANGPTAFDCSGYVRYVLKAAGVDVTTLPRTSAGLGAALTRVAKADRRPGDLIFFGSAKDGIHHVAIYAGDDLVWHAPGSGRTVTEAKLWTTQYTVARAI